MLNRRSNLVSRSTIQLAAAAVVDMKKPDTTSAMLDLVQQIRAHIPFDELDDARVCSGVCIGCAKNLLEYLEQEIIYWESSLARGEIPSLGDINKLARSAKKIYKVLQLNNLV